ncbi:hypothetical protein EIP86_004680 [Pleurotus ostreatoroseus]|nr:hypothetical protein EIP86_004680 [Pleurotus ostreatoroseus]
MDLSSRYFPDMSVDASGAAGDVTDASFQIPTAVGSSSRMQLLADESLGFLDAADVTLSSPRKTQIQTQAQKEILTPRTRSQTRRIQAGLPPFDVSMDVDTPRSTRTRKARSNTRSRSPRKRTAAPVPVPSPLKHQANLFADDNDDDADMPPPPSPSPFKFKPQEHSFQIPTMGKSSANLLLDDDSGSFFRKGGLSFMDDTLNMDMNMNPAAPVSPRAREPLTLSQLSPSPRRTVRSPAGSPHKSKPTPASARIANPITLDENTEPATHTRLPSLFSTLQAEIETLGRESAEDDNDMPNVAARDSSVTPTPEDLQTGTETATETEAAPCKPSVDVNALGDVDFNNNHLDVVANTTTRNSCDDAVDAVEAPESHEAATLDPEPNFDFGFDSDADSDADVPPTTPRPSASRLAGTVLEPEGAAMDDQMKYQSESPFARDWQPSTPDAAHALDPDARGEFETTRNTLNTNSHANSDTPTRNEASIVPSENARLGFQFESENGFGRECDVDFAHEDEDRYQPGRERTQAYDRADAAPAPSPSMSLSNAEIIPVASPVPDPYDVTLSEAGGLAAALVAFGQRAAGATSALTAAGMTSGAQTTRPLNLKAKAKGPTRGKSTGGARRVPVASAPTDITAASAEAAPEDNPVSVASHKPSSRTKLMGKLKPKAKANQSKAKANASSSNAAPVEVPDSDVAQGVEPLKQDVEIGGPTPAKKKTKTNVPAVAVEDKIEEKKADIGVDVTAFLSRYKNLTQVKEPAREKPPADSPSPSQSPDEVQAEARLVVDVDSDVDMDADDCAHAVPPKNTQVEAGAEVEMAAEAEFEHEVGRNIQDEIEVAHELEPEHEHGPETRDGDEDVWMSDTPAPSFPTPAQSPFPSVARTNNVAGIGADTGPTATAASAPVESQPAPSQVQPAFTFTFAQPVRATQQGPSARPPSPMRTSTKRPASSSASGSKDRARAPEVHPNHELESGQPLRKKARVLPARTGPPQAAAQGQRKPQTRPKAQAHARKVSPSVNVKARSTLAARSARVLRSARRHVTAPVASTSTGAATSSATAAVISAGPSAASVAVATTSTAQTRTEAQTRTAATTQARTAAQTKTRTEAKARIPAGTQPRARSVTQPTQRPRLAVSGAGRVGRGDRDCGEQEREQERGEQERSEDQSDVRGEARAEQGSEDSRDRDPEGEPSQQRPIDIATARLGQPELPSQADEDVDAHTDTRAGPSACPSTSTGSGSSSGSGTRPDSERPAGARAHARAHMTHEPFQLARPQARAGAGASSQSTGTSSSSITGAIANSSTIANTTDARAAWNSRFHVNDSVAGTMPPERARSTSSESSSSLNLNASTTSSSGAGSGVGCGHVHSGRVHVYGAVTLMRARDHPRARRALAFSVQRSVPLCTCARDPFLPSDLQHLPPRVVRSIGKGRLSRLARIAPSIDGRSSGVRASCFGVLLRLSTPFVPWFLDPRSRALLFPLAVPFSCPTCVLNTRKGTGSWAWTWSTALPPAKPTIPISFHFESDARLEARRAGFAASASSSTSHHLPIPDFKTLHEQQAREAAARRAPAVPVQPQGFKFSTDTRMAERARWDEARREREREAERVAEEERRRREEEEEREVKEMRRKAVPKAHEVPEWYAFAPKRARVEEEDGEEEEEEEL